MAGAADTRRTFFGVELDDTTRELLSAHLRAHVSGRGPGRPVPAANWHITLRFVGPATDLQIEKMLHGVSVAHLPAPFDVRFGGMGGFPRPARASVFWLGLGNGEPLAALAGACEEAAVTAGFEPEGRPFHAHLTLARVRPPVDVRSFVAAVPPFDVAMSVRAVTLFESQLGRGPARYEALERIAL